MPNFEIPEIDISPVSKAITEIIQKDEVDNYDLSAPNIHIYLFGRDVLDDNIKASLEDSIYKCKDSILTYLGGLEQNICGKTARAISSFDIAFFDTRYSGILEIHGDTGQLVDKLSEDDLQRLSQNSECLEKYIDIKANHELLFALKKAESLVKKAKPIEASWTDGIFEL